MTEVDLHIYINFKNEPFLNPTSVKLLRHISITGSLNMAAKEVGISYQNAWTIINNMNNKAPNPLVIKQRGGSGGGGAVLSEYGKFILTEYSVIEQQVANFTQMLNNEINL